MQAICLFHKHMSLPGVEKHEEQHTHILTLKEPGERMNGPDKARYRESPHQAYLNGTEEMAFREIRQGRGQSQDNEAQLELMLYGYHIERGA